MYMSQIQAQYAAIRAAGLSVTLDLGLQYAPSWALQIPGSAFVDQYGDVFSPSAASGELAANAVYNPTVQQAQANYIQLLSGAFGKDAFQAIRVGGLLTGELRMPGGQYNGHVNCWWAFSPTAQAGSPVPGYKPGVSPDSPTADTEFLNYYLNGMVQYQDFLEGAVRQNFNGDLEMMYPSFGVRPGDITAAIASQLNGTSVRSSELFQAVDFERLIARLPVYQTSAPNAGRIIAYTTWLDGPDFGTSPQQLSPVGFISSLAKPLNIAVAGENTASSANSTSALTLCKQRVTEYGLVGLMWFSTTMLTSSTIVNSQMVSAPSE